MLKPLLLLLSTLSLLAQNTYEQNYVPQNDNPTSEPPKSTVDLRFNYIDAPLADIVWCSEKKNVIFILSEKNTLYRSVDDGFSGHLMTEHLQQLGKQELGGVTSNAGLVGRIIQSPVDKSMMLFLGTEGISWVTTDCGGSFKVLNQGRRVDEFQFHPTEKNWLLASAWTLCEDFAKDEPCRRYKELFVTMNLGERWESIADYVFQFSWGKIDTTFFSIPKERIIIAHQPSGDGHQKLSGWNDKIHIAYSDDFFKTSTSLVQGGNKFLVTSYFMFAVQVSQQESDEVTLLVGDPREKKYDLKPIQLPVKRLMEHSYTILDTSEHSVFLHINHDGEKSMYGNVYVSDSTGVRYSMALNGNIRNSDGQCDFERVQGLEGIYLANVYDTEVLKRFRKLDFDSFPQQGPGTKKTAESAFDHNDKYGGNSGNSAMYSKEASKRSLEDFKKTMVSFDKGGIWQPLVPPYKDSEGKRIECQEECSLHLHSISNSRFGPFYTTENSLGIVLGTGNVGTYLSNKADEINTYLSRDGGLTWFEIAKGSHIYEVGDHGSILVMAPDQHATTEVFYSWNEGLTWETLKISEVPIEIRNIIIEPTNTAEKFLIYGRVKDVTNRGVIIAADFTPLHQRWCKGHDKPDTLESDYETFTPNGKISPHCLMGRQISFIRRKREAECFNSEEYEEWKLIQNCQCTEEDWECDYGFVRVKDGPCLSADEKFLPQTRNPPEECNAYYFITQGYRKVAGNTCEGGVTHDPIRAPCPGMSALNSKNFMVLLGLISIVLGMVWMSNKENSEKAKGVINEIYKKVSSKIPRRGQDTPLGFKNISEIPDTLRDEDDDFGRIVFEETEEKAEPIEDAHLFEYTQSKKMTERKGIEAASKPVPMLNKPGEKKMK